MVFNKEICMLIYVNQNNGEKMSCLKTNLNIKNININIKHLRKTIIKKPAHRNSFHQETRQKNPALHPAIYCEPQTVNLHKSNISNICFA